MKNKSSAPSKSQRSMPAGPAREARKNQAMLDRSASLGDSGPKTARFAPSKSPRPMSAAPARAVRAGQAMLDRSARLGDSGPKTMPPKSPNPMVSLPTDRPRNTGPENIGSPNASTAFRVSPMGMGAKMKKPGYKKGGSVGCKTY